jgi:drug/metabolite transporter (DMT)-like permease
MLVKAKCVNFGPLLLNAVSTVALVAINKELLTSYEFVWTHTLCGLHFLFTAACSRILSPTADYRGAPIGAYALTAFTLVSVVSIASLTISLKLNSVGFYQLSKLLTVSVTCSLEWLLLGKFFPVLTLISIVVTSVGVGLTVTGDLSLNLYGILVAIVAILSAGSQQVAVGWLQEKYSLSANGLVYQVFHWQALVLLIGGPIFDLYLYESSPLEWCGFQKVDEHLALLLLSCGTAVAVNYTQVVTVKELSATGYQVLGNLKTICIVIMGCAFFDAHLTRRSLFGQCVCVIGMMTYSYSYTRRATSSKSLSDGTQIDTNVLPASGKLSTLSGPTNTI